MVDSDPGNRIPHSSLVELTLSRFREFLREPGAVFWAFGFPLLLALGLGLAFRERPEPVPRLASDGAGWLDESLNELDEAGSVERVELAESELDRALAGGSIDLWVGLGESTEEVVFRFDPDRAEGRAARQVVDDLIQRARGRIDVFASRDLAVRSRTRYIDFLFPGILGMTLMSSTVWGIGYSLVLMRKRKLLKRLAATPMRRHELLLGLFLSRVVFLLAEVLVLVLFARLVFDVQVAGSLLALLGFSLLGSMAFAGLSLTVAARVESIEAANGWLNFVTLPMWMLSGIFFSYERFPEAFQLPIRLLPLSALNDALRGISIEGLGLFDLGFEFAVLVVWGLATFAFARARFRWQ